MKTLEIVITHYKEPAEIGMRMLRTIALQRCVDFSKVKVTVVNDGGNRLPDECLSFLPCEAEQIDIPHGGVSAARNAGLDHADAEWIMFCDFDDCFAGVYSLREYMNVLPADMDMLWCKILAENYLNGKELLYYVPDKQRFVFCHGKVYRTAFLREKEIRFDTDLTFNEDSCFNAVIIARTPHKRIGELRSNFPLYVWISRDGSVTNSGREDEAAYGHFHRNLKVVDEYAPEDDRYAGMVTRTVYDTFYTVHGTRNSVQMRRKIAEEFAAWADGRLDVFGQVNDDIMRQIREISRMELCDFTGIRDDRETVLRWAKGVTRSYKAGQGVET